MHLMWPVLHIFEINGNKKDRAPTISIGFESDAYDIIIYTYVRHTTYL